jgi:hypothetical protein
VEARTGRGLVAVTQSTCRSPTLDGLLDDVVEIPMFGTGASLNVAVAGSLVLYRLAGLA